MNFQMTEEQEMAVESVRKFVQNEIEPEIRAHGEKATLAKNNW